MRETDIDLAAGVALTHALVAELARRHGIRALHIKGPAFTLLGVPDQPSSDVDLLVPPSQLDQMITALTDAGWINATVAYDECFVVPRHSTTLHHPQWRCPVDVHHYVPGLLREPEAAFEEMWRDARPVEVAHQKVMSPSVEDAAIIWATNVIRDTDLADEAGAMEDLGRRVNELQAFSAAGFAHRAVELGATQTLESLFVALHIAPPTPLFTDDDALQRWRLLRQPGVRGQGTLGLVLNLRSRPVHAWPSTIARALWQREVSPRDNLSRVLRGVRKVPLTLRTLRRTDQ